MNVSLSRRSFFKGQFRASAHPVARPPWALAEDVFVDTCSRCDKCIVSCEEGVIERAGGGYPEMNFSAGECTFCGACAEACNDSALVQNMAHDEAASPWDLIAQIGSSCLSAKGVTCRVCGDRCDARAIRFQLAVGGVANPVLDQSACTGCGACVAPCPTGAVEIKHSSKEEGS
ncbi:ferredoxin-type protein NapF [Pseudomonadota bacterium]